MQEIDLKKLFLIIVNTYPNFVVNDTKTVIWLDLLKDVPFETAQQNLRAYVMNPANQFPPHPGALAALPLVEQRDHYVPDVEETRRYLEKGDREWAALPPPSPKVLQEARARLGYEQRPH